MEGVRVSKGFQGLCASVLSGEKLAGQDLSSSKHLQAKALGQLQLRVWGLKADAKAL